MYKVIVAITTYNLEKYVAQALDSVIMQKTNFKFKIKVADDCSTDRTPEILKEYSERYPELIEVLYSDKNLGSLANSNRLFDHIDCEYFSFLDGDDYWIDEDRLQKQVDFLDNHPDYTICGGNTRYLIEERLDNYVIPKGALGKNGRTYTIIDDIKGKMPYVHTSSILLRNVLFRNGLPSCYKDVLGTFEECAMRGEDSRRLLHLSKGDIFVFNEVYSIYRVHQNGIWQSKPMHNRRIEAAIQYNYYFKVFEGIIKKECAKRFKHIFRKLLIDMAFPINRSQILTDHKSSLLFESLCNDLATNPRAVHIDKKSGILYGCAFDLLRRMMLKIF